MDLQPQHPTYLLNSPQRPKSLENSWHELLSSRVTETQPSQAASTLVLREKGLREGEKTGVEGCLHTWASQIPQFTEQREREGILQTTIKHTLIMPELETFKHQMSWKHHYIRQAVEEKPPHGMNGDNQYGSGGICEWSAMAYRFINFIYLFLSCSKKIFVQHSKRLWIKSANFNGRGRGNGRMEEKWVEDQFPILQDSQTFTDLILLRHLREKVSTQF